MYAATDVLIQASSASATWRCNGSSARRLGLAREPLLADFRRATTVIHLSDPVGFERWRRERNWVRTVSMSYWMTVSEQLGGHASQSQPRLVTNITVEFILARHDPRIEAAQARS